MTQTNNHDLLAWRLACILQKLNQGERLNPNALAEEFGVHKRTIQRDLLGRFSFLPLEKVDGLFALNPAYLGRITIRDIERFAGLAGLNGLFPGLDTQFIRELFDSRLQDTLDIHGGNYEDLQQRIGDFRTLQSAIGQRRLVRFSYRKADGDKWVEVAPYRLINHAGIWYLAAADRGQPKAYAFGKISALTCLDTSYTSDPNIESMLDEEDSIWLNEKKTEVVLTVAPAAAIYFRRRKLVAQQVIEKELENGGLIVSGKFAHPAQILPIVRYWIPHVRIVSPEDWQGEMERQLQAYQNT
ncbi:YafY family protein [Azonexus sp.]|uniref:helix-turn-helix transcriptional regulator n=1 Tax=Azonexus sp. TaxID=1872668 RepID=UPI0027BA014E|nr:WYL domain-containing protein [Azonexus sp.]